MAVWKPIQEVEIQEEPRWEGGLDLYTGDNEEEKNWREARWYICHQRGNSIRRQDIDWDTSERIWTNSRKTQIKYVLAFPTWSFDADYIR